MSYDTLYKLIDLLESFGYEIYDYPKEWSAEADKVDEWISRLAAGYNQI